MSRPTGNRVRVRFAPSPTGHLHVGGARTAIFNWLFARHHGGDFILRVEDTDAARSTRESERMVLEDLRWLGLDWDEGPDCGGPHAPYRQSERLDRYRQVADRLIAEGQAYPCFCDEAILERKRREAEAAGRSPHYDLTCYRLEPSGVRERLDRNEPFVVRFHVPENPGEGSVAIHDLIRGDVQWSADVLGDFILLRTDGMPTYNFSVVVDDHDMEISHVIRAEEHLTNSHRQVLISRALGWAIPQFAHVSLILAEDRTKLSKRHGATSVSAFAEEGYLPESMLNYLTLLGWSAPSGEELFSREYAIENFSFDRVNASPAVFDRTKFKWMNGQYLHQMSPAALIEATLDRFRDAGWVEEDGPAVRDWLADALDLVRPRAETLAELLEQLRFVWEFDPATIQALPEVREVLEDAAAVPVIRALVEDLSSSEAPRSGEDYQQLIGRIKLATGVKGRSLFMPVRVALTGSAHGPELQRGVPLLEIGSGTAGLAPIIPPRERAVSLLRALEPGVS